MRKKRFPLLFVMGIALVIIDQLLKLCVRQRLGPNHIISVISGFFYITFTKNTGAAFGSLQDTNSILIWVTLIAIGLILYLWDEFPKCRLSRVSLMLVLAGTIGNLIDRIFLGYVTDFLDFRVWPVFNLADSMVTMGIIILMALMLRDGLLARNLSGKPKVKSLKPKKKSKWDRSK